MLYDDNYGCWEDGGDEDMQAFYFDTQKTNVKKKCVDCGQTVSIQPHYECCSSCADIRERGGY